MSKSNGLESDFLNWFLRATAPSWAGNTQLWLALFTSDPGESMSLTNEATYVGYSRTAIARSGSSPFGASSAGSSPTNSGTLSLAACSGGSPQSITHFALVTTASGACEGYSVALASTVVVSNGITPFISAGALSLVED